MQIGYPASTRTRYPPHNGRPRGDNEIRNGRFTFWELGRTRESLRQFQFAGIAFKRHEPACDSSEWGDRPIIPLLSPAGPNACDVSLPLQSRRVRGRPAITAAQFRFYPRLRKDFFSKPASITLLAASNPRGKQTRSSSAKWTSPAPSWETGPAPKITIQYAARTTTGPGHLYLQMELAHRVGVAHSGRKRTRKIPSGRHAIG